VAEQVSASFVEFVSARYPALVRLAFLLVGDRGHAEDLVQSSLYRTFLAWEKLRAIEAAEAYTRTTMIRLAGHWSRRRWRGEIPDAGPESRQGRFDPDGSVDAALDMQVALSQLPYAQRAVLVLRFFDDLSEAQVASVLGCSVGTVKSRTSRGLARLRAAGLLSDSTAMEARDG
jgi:RNA polymerase sigma-70 factor (sigma-E family)